MYLTVRRYQNAAALGDAMSSNSGDVEKMISAVNGFVSYNSSRDGDTVTSVTVCNDKAGCEETTRVAGQWVKDQGIHLASPPEVSGGPVFINFGK